MIAIISSLIPLIMKLLGVYFESQKANKEQRQAFLEFVKAIQPQAGESAKGRESYGEQVKRLQEQIDRENGK
jgi:hypothetical protein